MSLFQRLKLSPWDFRFIKIVISAFLLFWFISFTRETMQTKQYKVYGYVSVQITSIWHQKLVVHVVFTYMIYYKCYVIVMSNMRHVFSKYAYTIEIDYINMQNKRLPKFSRMVLIQQTVWPEMYIKVCMNRN